MLRRTQRAQRRSRPDIALTCGFLATCALAGIACGGAPARPTEISNASRAPATRKAQLGGYAATIPESWKAEGITSDTQLARFHVPNEAELLVLSGGEYEVSGIDWFARWRDELVPNEPRLIEVLPGTIEARLMRVTGRYFDQATRVEHPDHAMIVALVESGTVDRHYFKLLGPRADVVAHEAAFRAMLASLKPY